MESRGHGSAEADVQPGDFCVVSTGSRMTKWIKLGERLYTGGFAAYDHAFICSQRRPDGTLMIVEAQPGGAVETAFHYAGRPHLWSTGRILSSPAAGSAAIGYVGTPYSFLDYEALAAHHWHLPLPGLLSYIKSTRHMICSQLVDQCEMDAGVHLFEDGRWPGYVTPQDLANLIAASPQIRA